MGCARAHMVSTDIVGCCMRLAIGVAGSVMGAKPLQERRASCIFCGSNEGGQTSIGVHLGSGLLFTTMN